MTKGDLIEWLKDVPEDANVMLSRYFLIDKDEGVSGILDIPIHGIAYSPNDNEVRFAVNDEDIDKELFGKWIKVLQ